MSAPRLVRTLPPRAAKRLAFFARSASTATSSSSRLAPRPAPTAAAPAAATPSSTSSYRPLHASSRAAAYPAPSRPYKARTTAAAANGGSDASAADAAVTDADADAVIPEAASTSPPSGDPSSAIDWSSSFHGLSTNPFPADVAAVLMTPVDPQDVEIKPDGILYLPEIKYRRILNAAFGPGGWGLAPRGELAVGEKVVSREYALVVQGRFVGQARGECPYFGGEDGVATAGEGCKSNALMRCCKDLGVASELWDPRFIRQFKQAHGREVWVEHVATKKRRQIWLRKDCPPAYPYALATGAASKVVR